LTNANVVWKDSVVLGGTENSEAFSHGIPAEDKNSDRQRKPQGL
jgi:hypothetical protein